MPLYNETLFLNFRSCAMSEIDDNGDGFADAISVVALILIAVTTVVYWVSTQ